MSTSILRRLGAPVASSVLTTVVLAGALWMQHARAAWPFAPPGTSTVMAATGTVTPPAGSGATHDRAPVDAAAVDSLDIRLETVGRGSLTQSVRAVATVVPDESRISHVHTRVAGWVDQLDVNTTGQFVRAGQPLARIFSQELLSSQTEYLAARTNTTASGIASAVVAGGRARLMVLGMTEADIDVIERSGEPARWVTIVAPRSGVVVNRGVTVGTSVDPSTTLVTIADLSSVWILAEVPESNITAVRPGTIAQLDFPASGRTPFMARIDFVYPTLTERTRTLRVRLSVGNPGGALRPGLYGTATFESIGRNVMTVPRDAVVDTGEEQHVFVATGESFEPRAVLLGVRLTDRVEIREGLRPGEQIVVSGLFLLDSESRLRATGGGTGHAHGLANAKDAGGASSPSSVDPHAGHRK
ncbi:MAG: efflux RND transporter periplasmic adaptor subunit [Acidobacteriota bacterium]